MKYLCFFLTIIIIFSCNQTKDENKALQKLRNIRYAHQKINIRNGPGKNYQVSGTLVKHNVVEVDSLIDGWYLVYGDGVRKGFVYAELLKESPLREVITSDGTFDVPGTAYVDGRDPNAYPPLTIMDLNIWDSLERFRPLCTIKHGTKVKLSKVEYKSSEERYYFYISSNNCSGWLTQNFLNTRYKKPIGDKFYK